MKSAQRIRRKPVLTQKSNAEPEALSPRGALAF